jgi:hypothetical protein
LFADIGEKYRDILTLVEAFKLLDTLSLSAWPAMVNLFDYNGAH